MAPISVEPILPWTHTPDGMQWIEESWSRSQLIAEIVRLREVVAMFRWECRR